MKRHMNVGLFGGTFDPCHSGHLFLARAAVDYCQLDRVEFIPAAAPPHKHLPCITSFTHRSEIIRLAIEGENNFYLSDIESTLPVPSYTVDTLLHYRDSLPASTDLFFIIGKDAFLEIISWKKFKRVLSLSHFVVFEREGYDNNSIISLLKSLGYKLQGDIWQSSWSDKYVILPPLKVPMVSSSEIRKMIQSKNCPLESVVLKNVAVYIRKNHLYNY